MAVRKSGAVAGTPVLTQTFEIPPNSKPSGDSEPAELSFWEHLSAIPETGWWSGEHDGSKGFKVYLYDHALPGSPYIAVITEPFEIDWVRHTYGGGKYRAQLNDPSGRIVSREVFAIEGEAKRRKNSQTAVAAEAPPPIADSFQTQVLSIIREQNERMESRLDRMMERINSSSRGADVAGGFDPNIALKGVVDMFSGLLGKQQQPQPNLVEQLTLLKNLMPQQPDMFATLLKFKEAGLVGGGKDGGDLLEQITTITAVAEKLGLTAGGSGRSLGEVLIDKGPEIVGEIRKAVTEYRTIEEKRLETARTIANIQANQANARPAPAPAAPAPATPGAYAGAAAPEGAGMGLEVDPIHRLDSPPPPEGAAVVDEVDLLKQKIVTAILQGATGGDIVSTIDVMAPALIETFHGCTEKNLADFFGGDPILVQATKSARFAECMAEIVETLNGSDDEPPAHGPN